ncbi:hypothetical protein BOTBODRAFT_637978 [Botryobasidium botryosum FD-172 SS1]|uniref:Uncharacterized protein n=1 Tax=Botryobasidium botryosum (strain FD-172 SS1) TaxID=930990 RepID=A0A067MI97_BOTB1|nr:hypothetical protein BOTBODRAFT_637978 [Botryobasidium botryosum FD-172 SS1]
MRSLGIPLPLNKLGIFGLDANSTASKLRNRQAVPGVGGSCLSSELWLHAAALLTKIIHKRLLFEDFSLLELLFWERGVKTLQLGEDEPKDIATQMLVEGDMSNLGLFPGCIHLVVDHLRKRPRLSLIPDGEQTRIGPAPATPCNQASASLQMERSPYWKNEHGIGASVVPSKTFGAYSSSSPGKSQPTRTWGFGRSSDRPPAESGTKASFICFWSEQIRQVLGDLNRSSQYIRSNSNDRTGTFPPSAHLVTGAPSKRRPNRYFSGGT